MVMIVPREEIPQEQTWNAEAVFPTLDDWHAEYESLSQEIPKLGEYAGKLSEGPQTLLAFLQSAENVRRRVSKLGFYAMMRNACNSHDAEAKPLVGQAMGLYGLLGKTAAFGSPEMLAIGEETLLQWVRENDDLAIYEHMVRDLFRQQQYVRSEEVETILGMLREPFAATEQIAEELTNTDLRFPDAIDSEGDPFAVAQSSIESVKHHQDREIRRTGWQNYADQYLAFQNTLAQAYLASVKQNTMQMRVRGYDSVLHMKLFPHNLPVEVFHNLIETFKKNLPTWHRYWDVKRRALGVEQIRPWDIWAPLTNDTPHVPFEQSVQWIVEGMTPLGEEYIGTLRRGCLDERWVDRAVNEGKRQGAFSYGTYDTAPYIMMSYNDTLDATSTLAHELGHSMHSYYSRKNQPFEYSGYSMFVAETASNFNQAMVRAHLFEAQPDRNFQLTLIDEAMENFHRYFFIMPTLARFEYEVHERVAAGKPMTADILNGLMRDLYAEGYGDTMTDDPQRTGITWAQFGHLYEAFYTFQYATGISAAHALADQVRSDPAAAERYLGFLAAGSSVYPLDALKMAGVDMTTPEPVEKAFAVLGDLVDRLESLLP